MGFRWFMHFPGTGASPDGSRPTHNLTGGRGYPEGDQGGQIVPGTPALPGPKRLNLSPPMDHHWGLNFHGGQINFYCTRENAMELNAPI